MEEIGRDHSALAILIEQFGQICNQRKSQPVDCADISANEGEFQTADCKICANERHQLCKDLLTDLVRKLSDFMLNHFDHEYALMDALPGNKVNMRHCEQHRSKHAEFFARYNKIVMEFCDSNLFLKIEEVGLFLSDWSHEHALVYDDQLIYLAEKANSALRMES